MSEKRQPKEVPRGAVVEAVRLIFVAIFTAGGWRIAREIDVQETSLVVAIVLGSAIGYVVGGVLGRKTVTAVSAVEHQFRKTPASELLAGMIGLILGLVLAVLASVLLFRFPPEVAYPSSSFITVVLTYTGYRVGRAKKDDLFGMIGVKPRAFGARPSEVNVLDTSALIDGRILDVVRAGFLEGTFLVLRGVLDELQTIADSSDPERRRRGQRGLQVLNDLQRSNQVEVLLIEEESTDEVDAQLVRLARDRGGVVVTSDANLGKVAQALNVPVRSMNALAAALRPPYLPGEWLTVRMAKAGRENGQGVGYLDDGTMVVVEGGLEFVGSEIRVNVTNVLQTSTGRMVFARLGEGE